MEELLPQLQEIGCMNPETSTLAFDPDPRMYDEVMGPVYFEGFAVEMARRLAALHPLQVLETACGTGRLTHQMDLHLPASVSIMATDIHPAMLSFAIEKFPSSSRIRWQEADALDLPFEDASFDVVACQFGAMFFSDKGKGFAEACRVLKPAGNFLFSVWDKLDHNPMAAA